MPPRVDGVKAPQHRETPRTDLRAKPPLSRRRCCCCSASSPCPAPWRAWRPVGGRRSCRPVSRRPCPLSFRRRRPSSRDLRCGLVVVAAARGKFRRVWGGGGGVGVYRRPLRPLGPPARRAALQQRSAARSVLFVNRPARPQRCASRGLPYRSGLKKWVGDAAARFPGRGASTKSAKATDFLVSYMPLAAHPSPHSLLHTEEPSGGPGAAPRRPRGTNVGGSFVRPTTLPNAKRCPTMDP